MQLLRRQKLKPGIPLSSMADIAFLLLIFFIVTSVLKFQEEQSVEIPNVPKLEVIEQRNRQDLWINKQGQLLVNNRKMPAEDLRIHFAQIKAMNPDVVVFINADTRCPFAKVEAALDALKQAGTERVVFVSKQEQRDEQP